MTTSALSPLICFPIQTRIIVASDDIVSVIMEHVAKAGVVLRDGDVLVISSKVCALCEGMLCEASSSAGPVPSAAAMTLAERTKLPARFVEAVIEDSDEVIGVLPHVLATTRRGVMIANAGIDQSNAGAEGNFIRLPRDPDATALRIMTSIRQRSKALVGVILADSVVHALRRGTSGVALGVAGIQSVANDVGKKDLFGRTMRITVRAVADNISSAALLLMGETDDRCPVVVVRGSRAEIIPDGDPAAMVTTADTLIDRRQCLYMGTTLVPNPETQQFLRTLDLPPGKAGVYQP